LREYDGLGFGELRELFVTRCIYWLWKYNIERYGTRVVLFKECTHEVGDDFTGPGPASDGIDASFVDIDNRHGFVLCEGCAAHAGVPIMD
jgi:hypothetical protein